MQAGRRSQWDAAVESERKMHASGGGCMCSFAFPTLAQVLESRGACH